MDNKQMELLNSIILKDRNELQSIENLLPSDKDEKLIKPLFKLLSNNPKFDFGSPGMIVHYLEKFDNDVYVPELYRALNNTISEHLIWMLSRYINSVDGKNRKKGIEFLRSILEKSKDQFIINVANEFLQDYEDE